jgi:hypothetical protein
MIDPAEAAQKIAAANAEIRQAKMALPSPGQEAKVKMAERRLAVLLRVYKGFKDHPDFIAAYRREMSALGGEVARLAAPPETSTCARSTGTAASP